MGLSQFFYDAFTVPTTGLVAALVAAIATVVAVIVEFREERRPAWMGFYALLGLAATLSILSLTLSVAELA